MKAKFDGGSLSNWQTKQELARRCDYSHWNLGQFLAAMVRIEHRGSLRTKIVSPRRRQAKRVYDGCGFRGQRGNSGLEVFATSSELKSDSHVNIFAVPNRIIETEATWKP
jgi:hypothetical protein